MSHLEYRPGALRDQAIAGSVIGPDPDDPLRAPASIDEGDNVLKRLLRRSQNA